MPRLALFHLLTAGVLASIMGCAGSVLAPARDRVYSASLADFAPGAEHKLGGVSSVRTPDAVGPVARQPVAAGAGGAGIDLAAANSTLPRSDLRKGDSPHRDTVSQVAGNDAVQRRADDGETERASAQDGRRQAGTSLPENGPAPASRVPATELSVDEPPGVATNGDPPAFDLRWLRSRLTDAKAPLDSAPLPPSVVRQIEELVQRTSQRETPAEAKDSNANRASSTDRVARKQPIRRRPTAAKRGLSSRGVTRVSVSDEHVDADEDANRNNSPPGSSTRASQRAARAMLQGEDESAETDEAEPSVDEPPDEQVDELLDHAIEAIERDVKSRRGSESERVRRDLRLRLLRLAAGRHEEALEPIKTLDEHAREFIVQQLYSLRLFQDERQTPVREDRYRHAARYAREAAQQLGAAGPLDLRNAAFCKSVDSFGVFDEFDRNEFKPDQEVLLYVELENFSADRLASGHETEFRASYQVLDAAGHRVDSQDLPRDKQVCRNPRRDYFIAYVIYLPKRIPPGPYTLQLTVEDVKGEKFGQTTLDLEIKKEARSRP